MSHPSDPPAVHGSPWKPGISRSQVDQFSYRLTRVGASLRVLATLVLCHDDPPPGAARPTLDLVPRSELALLIELIGDELDAAAPPLVDVAAAATWHAERRAAQ
ncbi:MAG: hypothetical protein MUF08_00465 [Burkholderiaceae bacterium]|jgi:hypothetical protein|nr:hypothetical protein [Burkholderiaceae bacterium]